MTAIGIAGLGLMGGSLALALAGRGATVTGYDPLPAVRDAARTRELAVCDEPAGLAACDLVFVAAPLGKLPETFAALAGCRGVVTDLGSTKATLVAAGESVFGGRFVGGHPMAGTEHSGFAHARPELFQGAVWVLTPTERTDPAALALVRRTLAPLAVRLVEMSAATHDEGTAAISHLPYLLACAVAETARRQPGEDAVRLLAASGFRDTTRLAMSNPAFGRDLCQNNRQALLQLIPQLQAVLGEWQAQIEAGDTAALETAFAAIADWRRTFNPKAAR